VFSRHLEVQVPLALTRRGPCVSRTLTPWSRFWTGDYGAADYYGPSWQERYEANRGVSVILTNTDWTPTGSERESNGCFCSVQLEHR